MKPDKGKAMRLKVTTHDASRDTVEELRERVRGHVTDHAVEVLTVV